MKYLFGPVELEADEVELGMIVGLRGDSASIDLTVFEMFKYPFCDFSFSTSNDGKSFNGVGL